MLMNHYPINATMRLRCRVESMRAELATIGYEKEGFKPIKGEQRTVTLSASPDSPRGAPRGTVVVTLNSPHEWALFNLGREVTIELSVKASEE